MIKRIFFTLVLAGGLCFAACTAELDPLLQRGTELWSMSGEQVMREVPGTFRWMDQAKSRLCFNAKTSRETLSLYGRKVQEAIFDFKDGQVVALSVSVYNRGDAGKMAKKPFEELQKELRGKIQDGAGAKLRPQSQNANVSGSRLYSLVWRTDRRDTVLRWSLSDKDPEYISIDFYPAGKAPHTLKEGIKTTAVRSELETKLQIDPDGSRYLLVPMVDQGAKGYCVAATVERVLRYYGSNIDQHVIAELANSDAKAGTSINTIIKVLEDNQAKLGIRFRALYRYELDNLKDLKTVIKEYNSIARRMNGKKIELDDYLVVNGGNRFLDFPRLMNAMDFQVFREVRKGEKRGCQAFLETVRSYIDNGVPLCWSTFIFPGAGDTNSSTFGMHMRIITGYNAEKGEIIFSDSWGAGHEKKRLKNEDAWGITVNLISLEPRRK